MTRLRWRYAVVFALATYALGFVFSDSLYSSRSLFVLGVILLYTSVGLWLRFRGAPKDQEPPSLPSGL